MKKSFLILCSILVWFLACAKGERSIHGPVALSQAYFAPQKQWYYKNTVIKTTDSDFSLPLQSGHLFEADLIYFSKTEDMLIGKRVKDHTPALAYRIKKENDQLKIDFTNNLIEQKYSGYIFSSDKIDEPNQPKSLPDYFDFTIQNSYGIIRHSFYEKKTSSFKPKNYPSKIINKDGKLIDINDRFGFFTTNIEKSDEESKDKKALMFNIGEKPIIYYTNILHPESLINASKKAIDAWNEVFKKALEYDGKKTTDILVFKKNNCNIENVEHWLTLKKPQIKNIIENITKHKISDIKNTLDQIKSLNSLSFTKRHLMEKSAKEDLEEICAALERLSSGEFTYERVGDLRYNFINLEVGEDDLPWSGYGPMFADPITGEIVSATANINLKEIDLAASNSIKEYSHKEKVEKIANSHLMDSLNFTSNLSLKLAAKYRDLDEESRFLIIREKIYEAVVVHELGHNLGLKHNMASHSDALNFFDDYWQENNDDETLKYSSIMGYAASELAHGHGVGKYDEAAIKFVYFNLLESFDGNNIKLNKKDLNIKNWLFLNDHKDIAEKLFYSKENIKNRQHIKVNWNNKEFVTSLDESLLVPYVFCDSQNGRLGPRCQAFDYGVDIKDSAVELINSYDNAYFFSLLRDKISPLTENIKDIILFKRFNLMLHWYFYLKNSYKNFKGSYREKDYLSALAMGLNHIGQILGRPSAGGHISAPGFMLERIFSDTNFSDRLKPSSIMLPLSEFSACEIKSLTNVDDNGHIEGRLEHVYKYIPIEFGRPLYNKLQNIGEDISYTYTGSMLSKKNALHFLLSAQKSLASISGLEELAKEEVSWLKVFPKATSYILSAILTKNYQLLGPIITANGEIKNRQILEINNLTMMNDEGTKSLLPAMEEDFTLDALENLIKNLPKDLPFKIDIFRALKIAKNYNDIDLEEDYELYKFTTLQGQTYLASTIPDMDPIGVRLLKKAQGQKETLERVYKCLNDENARLNDEFCFCVTTMERRSSNQLVCCDEKNPTCPQPILEPVGHGLCSMESLTRRKNLAQNELNKTIFLIETLRGVIKKVK